MGIRARHLDGLLPLNVHRPARDGAGRMGRALGPDPEKASPWPWPEVLVTHAGLLARSSPPEETLDNARTQPERRHAGEAAAAAKQQLHGLEAEQEAPAHATAPHSCAGQEAHAADTVAPPRRAVGARDGRGRPLPRHGALAGLERRPRRLASRRLARGRARQRRLRPAAGADGCRRPAARAQRARSTCGRSAPAWRSARSGS